MTFTDDELCDRTEVLLEAFYWFHYMQNKIYSRLRMNPAADEILGV